MKNSLLIIIIVAFFSSFSLPLEDDTWVNATYEEMTEDEKIGQLFFIRAHSNLGDEHIKSVKAQIKKYHVGGLCFFQGTPEKQAKLTNEYQSLSKIPLMVTMDAEWGLGMRFKEDAISFPKSMMLGAIKDDSLIEEMGIEIGRQLRAIGVHVNFAPVVDVNNNPENPVINYRSFGEDKYNVAAKSLAYMRGMRKSKVLACAKHFPGHGDTNVDSHEDLPVIQHSRHRLDSIELYPFKVLSKNDIGSMMVAHLHIPAFDNRKHRPSTLSNKTIHGVLRNYMGYEGLVFTDALEMKGVAKHFKPGIMEVVALSAGNDILLLPIDIEKAVSAIKKALTDGVLSWHDIEEKVKRILSAKHKLGLYRKPYPIDVHNVDDRVNTAMAEALKTKLIRQSLTLAKNENQSVPLFNLTQKIASVAFGASKKTIFQKQIDQYAPVKHFNFSKNLSPEAISSLLKELKSFDKVLVSVHDMSDFASKNFGLNISLINTIKQIARENDMNLTLFGSPYALEKFSELPSILVAYNEEAETQKLAAQGLFGAFSFKGVLPVSAGESFTAGQGVISPSLLRLGYSTPEEVGMSSDSLRAIDTIVAEMIKEKAAPGCQVLVAKEGKVVYHKTFGHHTYEKKQEPKPTDLYDVASVTKIMATTLSLMKLSDQGRLATENSVSDYLPEIDTTNKAGLILNDILAHHARLAGWIPFYKETQTDEKPIKILDKYYRKTESDSFNIRINDELFLRSDYQDSIYAMIYNNDLREKANYRYSDLGFYLFHKIIQRLSGQSLDQFAGKNFYTPLGLQRTLFNPLSQFDKKEILPTEDDKYFRNTVVHGYVHDMGAAMIGGVSGHAGLFSNANDLAILSQMLLNGGYYGGVQYLRPETIKKFTTRHPRSERRGLGFDMKQLDEDKTMNMSEKASDRTYGHLGFTGTCVWIDPKDDLIYIFLSNRTYPTMENKKFGKNEYRPRIQTAVYNAIVN